MKQKFILLLSISFFLFLVAATAAPKFLNPITSNAYAKAESLYKAEDYLASAKAYLEITNITDPDALKEIENIVGNISSENVSIPSSTNSNSIINHE